VRQGYGPRDHQTDGEVNVSLNLQQFYGVKAAPKPTQAYYAKGYTIYYGYTEIPVRQTEPETAYAFGYSLEYFRHLMPASLDGVTLNQYAVEIRNSLYGPGDFVAQNQHRGNAVTKVQSVTKTATSTGSSQLPAIGEKPSKTPSH